MARLFPVISRFANYCRAPPLLSAPQPDHLILTHRVPTPPHRRLSLSPPLHVTCRECRAESPKEGPYQFFCSSCLTLLPPDRGRSHFDVLGASRTFDVDTRAITMQKRNLLKKLHPDKFAHANDATDLRHSEDQSALVNEAAEVLMNPYKRGSYLLEMNQMGIEDGTNPDLGQDFLLEMMELNEEVAALKTVGATDKLLARVGKIVQSMERDLSEAFSGGDFAGDTFTTFNLEEAKRVLEKMKFFLNLEEKLKELQTRF